MYAYTSYYVPGTTCIIRRRTVESFGIVVFTLAIACLLVYVCSRLVYVHRSSSLSQMKARVCCAFSTRDDECDGGQQV